MVLEEQRNDREKAMKKILIISGMIIFSTILLSALIINLPYDPTKTMGPIFSILLGSIIIVCFIYITLRRDLFALFAIIYLSLVWILFPAYLLLEEGNPGALMNKISVIIYFNKGIYELITLLPIAIIFGIRHLNTKEEVK